MISKNLLLKYKESVQESMGGPKDPHTLKYPDGDIRCVLLKHLNSSDIERLNSISTYVKPLEGETPDIDNAASLEFEDNTEGSSYVKGGQHLGMTNYIDEEDCFYVTAKHVSTGAPIKVVSWDNVSGQVGGYLFYSINTGEVLLSEVTAANNEILSKDILKVSLNYKKFPYLLKISR